VNGVRQGLIQGVLQSSDGRRVRCKRFSLVHLATEGCMRHTSQLNGHATDPAAWNIHIGTFGDRENEQRTCQPAAAMGKLIDTHLVLCEG
jgi:hypothetical protein